MSLQATEINRYSRKILLPAAVLVAACVSPMPLAEQAPDPGFAYDGALLLAVIDGRDQAMPGSFGRAQDAFGRTTQLTVPHWYVPESRYAGEHLDDALADRLIHGLESAGWHLKRVETGEMTEPATARRLLSSHQADRLLTIVIRRWHVDANLNWISPMEFDWAVDLQLFDRAGNVILADTIKGTDVVEEVRGRPIPDHIRLAFRDRLEALLRLPELQAGLVTGAAPGSPDRASAGAGADAPPQAPRPASGQRTEPVPGEATGQLRQIQALESMLRNGTISEDEFADLTLRILRRGDAGTDSP